MTLLTGGCLCGAVRYESGMPREAATVCHCRSCQRASGASAVAWYSVGAGALVATTGAITERQSSAGRWRGYCGQCHSPLTYRSEERPGEIDVTVVSLDRPELLPPADHIFMSDAIAWDVPADGLPRFSGTRSASIKPSA